MWFVGIDAGGSNTRAIVADRNGLIVAAGHAGPGNSNTVGRKNVDKSLNDALQQCQQQLIKQGEHNGLLDRISSVYLGSAAVEKKMSPAAARQTFPVKNIPFVGIDSDSYTALVAAHGDCSGIIIIAGTGSIALAAFPDGTATQRLIAGGWGAYYGDEGSSYWLAAVAIRMVLQLVDLGNAPADLLADFLVLPWDRNLDIEPIAISDWRQLQQLLADYAQLPKNSRTDNGNFRDAIINRLYQKDAATWVAGFSAVMAQNNNGNQLITKLFILAGKCLAKLTHRLIANVNATGKENAQQLKVAYSGSLLNNNVMVRESFSTTLTKLQPEQQIVTTKYPQIVGSLLLAYRQSGIVIDEQLQNNISNSLTKFAKFL